MRSFIKTIARMTPEELEAAFGEDAYPLMGTIYWHYFRKILLVTSIFVVGAILAFLRSMHPITRDVLAIMSVSYSTGLVIYFTWSDLILRCMQIELMRRHRHATFLFEGAVVGEIGLRVTIQIAIALFIVIFGYVALGIAFGAAYYGTHGSTADGSFTDSVYFSFVTLGTIGYGDFQPHGFGKLLACIHSISYLLYQATAIGGVIAIISKITTEPGIGLGFNIVDDGASDVRLPASVDHPKSVGLSDGPSKE